MWFDQMRDQEVETNPNLPNRYRQLELVSCTNEDHPNRRSSVMG